MPHSESLRERERERERVGVSTEAFRERRAKEREVTKWEHRCYLFTYLQNRVRVKKKA
jgi:hypothetical protein